MNSNLLDPPKTEKSGPEGTDRSLSTYPLERRSGRERRGGEDRRKSLEPFVGPEKRNGTDRRKEERRSRKVRIPIFLKLAVMSTLLVCVVIFTISVTILGRQKDQFTKHLKDLGVSLIRTAANSAPDKILGDEDLAMFQLVKNIAENEQVVFALITDRKGIIKAHNRMEMVGKPYHRPKEVKLIDVGSEVSAGMIRYGDEDLLYFEMPVFYQKLKVGGVHLAISRKKIAENLGEAKFFILVLTLLMTALGILLSLGLSMYFSGPIRQLRESANALGMGRFNYRVKTFRNDELGDLAYAFNRMAEDLELNEKIKDSFGRYVTPEIVNMILANPNDEWMKGSKVQATVLFADIRGFTSISENKDPEAVLDLLNNYLTRVTDAVIKHGGHLNKFLGDEAMAVFGAPLAEPKHAEAAVKAALEIQRSVAALNEQRGKAYFKLGVGIGMNSGEVVAGNLGSSRRMEYTVIGDNVNVAARLTSIAKGGEILVTQRTYDAVQNKKALRVEERGMAPLKGRKKGITVYCVMGFEENAHELGKGGVCQS
ncbi:MAG: HAMP domain-containing protein [Deltaproteobacteria bacterium]|nr:HAMP domain-containing protein [Deltaproteobacteria bacterium]